MGQEQKKAKKGSLGAPTRERFCRGLSTFKPDNHTSVSQECHYYFSLSFVIELLRFCLLNAVLISTIQASIAVGLLLSWLAKMKFSNKYYIAEEIG